MGTHLHQPEGRPAPEDAVADVACAVLQGVAVDDLNDGSDDLRGYRSPMHGTPPMVDGYVDGAAQARAIAGHVRALRDDGAAEAGICLVLPTNRDLNRSEQTLAGEGIVTRRIQRRAADDPGAPGCGLPPCTGSRACSSITSSCRTSMPDVSQTRTSSPSSPVILSAGAIWPAVAAFCSLR
jgi:hypothetical protein